jgi:hypothetical protein
VRCIALCISFATINIIYNSKKNKKHNLIEYICSHLSSLDIKEFNLLDAKGYNIVVHAKKNNPHLEKKILSCLKKRPLIKTVKILQDKNYDFIDVDSLKQKLNIKIFRTAFMFSFFLVEFLNKNIYVLEKRLTDAKILILDENIAITGLIFDNICQHINYLTVVTDRDHDDYTDYIKKIFNYTGLIIHITKFSKQLIEEADIIIDTGANYKLNQLFEHNNKESSTQKKFYFNLSNNNNINIDKSQAAYFGIIYYDNINLTCNNKYLDLIDFEMILYCKNKYFREYINKKKYDSSIINLIHKEIDKYKIKISSFQK